MFGDGWAAGLRKFGACSGDSATPRPHGHFSYVTARQGLSPIVGRTDVSIDSSALFISRYGNVTGWSEESGLDHVDCRIAFMTDSYATSDAYAPTNIAL